MSAKVAIAEKLESEEQCSLRTSSSGDNSALNSQAFRFPRLPLGISDVGIALSIALAGIFVSFVGSVTLEFFRHTEADRTLIALEMVRSGNWLVPHLLGSEILTKPPLFYWLLASSITIFGSFEEWVARFPSVLLSGLYLASVFIFCRRAGAERVFSLIAAMCLGTSLLFSQLSTVAEIDLAFGFFSFLSFTCLYFSIRESSKLYTLLAYFCAALAFLTKGPQVVAFFALTFVAYCAWVFWFESDVAGGLKRRFFDLVWSNIVGVMFFCSIVGVWILLLAAEVGFQSLQFQFEKEVLQRVASESSRGRGAFYYLGSMFAGLSPWIVFMFLGLALPFTRFSRKKYKDFYEQYNYIDFLTFNLCVVLPAFALLSMAEGKSSRYIFPIYGNAAILVAFGLWQVRDTVLEKLGYFIGKYLFAIAAVVVIVAPFVASVTGVTMGNALLAAAAVSISAALLASSCNAKNRKRVILSAILLMCSIRVGQIFVYVPHRNETRSVKHIANQINKSIVPGRELYTIEMFERWIVYYLARAGREVSRISPQKQIELLRKNPDEKVLVLLNGLREKRLIAMLADSGHKIDILGEYDMRRAPLYLMEISTKALTELPVSYYFPTEYSFEDKRK